MSRVKLMNAIEPTKYELNFIELIERTHDSFGMKESSLVLSMGLRFWNKKFTARELRKYKELYNNFRYIDIVPQGKIVTINGLYKLVRHDSIYATKIRRKAMYDKICALIDEKNTRRLLGEQGKEGQYTYGNIENMNVDELIELANSLEEANNET